jgi:hypothetical protein
MDKVRIVVPIYKEILDMHEFFSLDHSLGILSPYSCTFIAPIGLNVSYYADRYNATFRFYKPEFFFSVQGYNRLLASEAFYASFKDVEFLLILQPDVFVFRDDLPRWLDRPFDYVGAPWPNGYELRVQAGKFAAIPDGKVIKTYVGNGGFSLRRREKCIALIREYPEIANWFVHSGSNEDLFFSIMGSLSFDFVTPNQMMASQFSVELDPEHYFELNGHVLPMGVHAWEKHNPDFWRAHMPPWPE